MNLKRIKQLFFRYFAENWRTDIGVFGVCIVFCGTFLMKENPALILAGILLTILIFAGKSFQIKNQTPSAGFYFMIPANAAEKCFSQIVINVLYFPLMMLTAMILGQWIGSNIQYHIFHNIDTQTLAFYNPQRLIRNLCCTDSLNLFLLLPSVFTFGALYFNKYAFFATSLCAVIMSFFICFESIPFILTIISDNSYSISWGGNKELILFHNDIVNNEITKYRLDFWHQHQGFIRPVVTLGISIFLWVLSYFRLRETAA